MTLHSDHGSKPRSKRLWRNGVSVGAVGARLAAISRPVLRIAQILLLVVTVGLIACLALLAATWQREWPRWFSGSATAAIGCPVVLVTAVISLLCIHTYRLRRNRSSAGGAGHHRHRPHRDRLRPGLQLVLEMQRRVPPELHHRAAVDGIPDQRRRRRRESGERPIKQSQLCPAPMPTALEVARMTDRRRDLPQPGGRRRRGISRAIRPAACRLGQDP